MDYSVLYIYIYIWAKLRYSTLGSLLKNFWHLSNLTTQANDVKTFFFFFFSSSFFFLYCNYKRTHGFRSWHCRISAFCWRINRYHHQKQTKKLPEKKKKKRKKGGKKQKALSPMTRLFSKSSPSPSLDRSSPLSDRPQSSTSSRPTAPPWWHTSSSPVGPPVFG